MPPLKELCVEITGKCLMNCKHCSSNSSSQNVYFITFDKIREILADAKSLSTEIIELSGGEPLLHPQIDEIIEAAKDFEVRLYTSGFTSDNNTNTDGIPLTKLKHLKNIGLDRIIFNLQGATAEAHKSISNTEGSFMSAINSINRAKIVGLHTSVHFVPMKLNYKELRAIAELCSELKINELAILRFVGQGRGRLNKNILELTSTEFNELLHDIVQTKKDFEEVLEIRTGCPMNFCSIIDRTIAPIYCKAGQSTLLIGYDGRAVPCPAFKQADEFSIGNLYTKSLKDIWEESSIIKSLKNYDPNNIQGKCSTCDYLDDCKGRCIAQRYLEHGDIYRGPDPLCPKERLKSHERSLFKEYAVS